MHKNTIIIATFFISTTIIIIIYTFAHKIISPSPPQQTLDQVASSYIEAMQQQNFHTLNQLCFPENNDCSVDMSDRVKIYNGLKLKDIRISYYDTPSALYWLIRIRAKGIKDNGQVIDINDSFDVRKREQDPAIASIFPDHRWYITVPPRNRPPLNSPITSPAAPYPNPGSYSPQSNPYPKPEY